MLWMLLSFCVCAMQELDTAVIDLVKELPTEDSITSDNVASDYASFGMPKIQLWPMRTLWLVISVERALDRGTEESVGYFGTHAAPHAKAWFAQLAVNCVQGTEDYEYYHTEAYQDMFGKLVE